jgi:hypothetical protein
MIVKYVKERGYQGEGKDPHLTLGKEYIAITVDFPPGKRPEISKQSDCDGTPGLQPIEFFEIIDSSLPENYCFKVYENGFASLQPVEFKGDFWDRYHDGDLEAEKLFEQVMTRLKKFHGWEV